MIIKNIHTVDELAESRLLCYQAFKQNIDNCSSIEAAMEMFQHSPTTLMKREWRNSMAAFDDNGVMFAQISHAISPIHFDGETSQMCAIGDVASIRKGTDAIKTLMHEILLQRREEGVAFSYLFPFSGRYYAQFGFSYCVMCKKWTLNLTQLDRGKKDLMVRPYEFKDKPYIEELQKTFVGRYNLSTHRQEINWHTARDLSHLTTKVAVSSKDIPVGYLTYTTKGQEDASVKITDFAVLKPTVLNPLLVSFLPQAQKATLVVPDDIPLELMIAELNLNNSTSQYQNNGMVRIVNLEKALLQMRHVGTGSLVMEVEDPLLQENNGRWEISWKDGITQTITKISHKRANLHLSIGQLSRFVCSGISKKSLQFFSDIPESLEPTILACFSEKPVGVFDYF